MSNSMVIRYTVRPEAAEENQRLVQNVFAELADNQPDGLHYATFRLADGVSFVHVVSADGEDNPLLKTAAFAEFQRNIADRVDRPAGRRGGHHRRLVRLRRPLRHHGNPAGRAPDGQRTGPNRRAGAAGPSRLTGYR